MEKEFGTTFPADGFDQNSAAKVLVGIAQRVATFESLRKGEFETTPEFRERKAREAKSLAAELPRYVVLPMTAGSVYDADAGQLGVEAPQNVYSGVDSGMTISVSAYGARWPADFSGGAELPKIVLAVPRDEAQALKPRLRWVTVARLPVEETARGDAEKPAATIGRRQSDLCVIPVAAFLCSADDGKIWHRLTIALPANLRVFAPGASLQDWIDAGERARMRIVSGLYKKEISDTQSILWELKTAIEYRQMAPTDPLAGLARLPDLPKPVPPIAVRQVGPKYPSRLARQGITGDVLVSFRVLEKGTVGEVKAVRSSHKEFEEAAIACVSAWRFKPATLEGRPVSWVMQVPIVFGFD